MAGVMPMWLIMLGTRLDMRHDAATDKGTRPTSPLRRFYVLRVADPTGVSGTGRIVEGVVFPDGRTVLRWRAPISSLVVFENFEAFKEVYLHKHRLCNTIIFVDPEPESGANP